MPTSDSSSRCVGGAFAGRAEQPALVSSFVEFARSQGADRGRQPGAGTREEPGEDDVEGEEGGERRAQVVALERLVIRWQPEGSH